MTYDADVTVIGTGPGGGIAACRLAEAGLTVAVLEKQTLPRVKPCGGAMPSSVRKLLDWDLAPYVENEVTRIRSLLDYAEPSDAAMRVPLLLVDRSRFDHHLAERAVRLGNGRVRLREEFTVVAVEEDTAGVTVRSAEGETVRSAYLIAADGAFSPTARALGLARTHRFGLALDDEVEVEPDVFAAHCDHLTVNFACLPGGYGWIFPKADGMLACGVAAWEGKPKLQRAMDDFLARSLPPGSIRRVERRGHPIPIYTERQRMATTRVCLVGDAAGLVDAVMGEGIRFALESGALAADVVAGLLGRGPAVTAWPGHVEGGCRQYERLARQAIAQKLEVLYRFVYPIFMHRPDLFYRRLIAAGGGWGYIPLADGVTAT